MSGWARYLALTAEAKTGLSLQVVVLGVVTTLATVATLLFLFLAAYLWVAQHYDGVTAGIVLGVFFLLLAIVVGVVCVVTRQRAIERARQELASRNHSPFLDPTFLALGFQIVRTIGWRRLVPLAVVGLLVVGLAKESGDGNQATKERRRD